MTSKTPSNPQESDLEKRLREGLKIDLTHYDDGEYGDDQEDFLDIATARALTAIKDAGYIQDPPQADDIESIHEYAMNGLTEVMQEEQSLNGKERKLMTGAEWYQRFCDLVKDHGFYEEVSRQFVLEAAKRASEL